MLDNPGHTVAATLRGQRLRLAISRPRRGPTCLHAVYRNPMKRRTEVVAFRADETLLSRMDSARKAVGLSRGDWVREVIVTHLHEDDDQLDLPAVIADLRQFIEQLDQSVRQLSTNQKRSLIILLTKVGDMDLDKAKEVARCKLSS
jgi:hypothetical protein